MCHQWCQCYTGWTDTTRLSTAQGNAHIYTVHQPLYTFTVRFLLASSAIPSLSSRLAFYFLLYDVFVVFLFPRLLFLFLFLFFCRRL